MAKIATRILRRLHKYPKRALIALILIPQYVYGALVEIMSGELDKESLKDIIKS